MIGVSLGKCPNQTERHSSHYRLNQRELVSRTVIGFCDLQRAGSTSQQRFVLIDAIVVFNFCVRVVQASVAHAFYEGVSGATHQAQLLLGLIDALLSLSELIGGLLQERGESI